ncbi:hypothetical protein ATCC90586_004748 [Pythium insidiosum]|nr:hypothetical protein ATCC90586_004748 [Pythium insidiosum]
MPGSHRDKLSYITEAQQTSIRAVAWRIGIDRKTVRQWVVKEKELAEAAPRGYRAVGAGRKLLSEELAFLLYSQINEERGERRRVTRNLIELWAKELAQALRIEGFTASNGWIDGFLSRHNLVMRKATNKTKLDEAQIVQRAVDFVHHVRKLIDDHGVTEDNIFNMDETAVFLDHNRGTTVDKRGATDVVIKSYGFEKNRITAICCADGKKKPPTLILQSTKSEMVLSNVDFMFPLVMPWKTLLVFDSALSHISKAVKEHLQRRKILYDDSRRHDCIDEWKRAGKFGYTRGGNVLRQDQLIVKRSHELETDKKQPGP